MELNNCRYDLGAENQGARQISLDYPANEIPRHFCRSKDGKILFTPAKREILNWKVSFHLDQLARDFRSGESMEEDKFNSDETNLVIQLHDNRTLDHKGDKSVKYAELVSGDGGMTLMVMIYGGRNSVIGT